MNLTTLATDDLVKVSQLLNAARDDLVRDGRVLNQTDIISLLFGPDASKILTFGFEEGREIVGVVSLYDIDWISRKGTIGNLTALSPWQALRGVRLLISYAFRQLGLHRVDCHVWEGNRLTPWICTKIGAKLEGTVRESVFRKGAFIDVDVYSLLDREMVWDCKI